MATDPRAYLVIETGLTKRLWKSWRAVSSSFWVGLEEALIKGDLGKAYSLATAIDLAPVVDQNREYIKYLLLQAAIFGASTANEDHRVNAVALGSYEQTLTRVSDVFCEGILRNTTLQVHAKALQLIAQHDPQHTQKAEGRRFTKDYVDFRTSGDRNLQMLATLNTSRLAVWGFTAEADLIGASKYMLSAILDGRTSDFCRMIDGRVFEVQQARTRIVDALSATDPNDLKVIQPWPNQSKSSIKELESLSTDELAARGYSVPPFHPYCRTICRRVPGEGSAVAATAPPPATAAAPMPPNPVKADSFSAVGAEITDSQLDYWNANVGQSPTFVLSQLTGVQPGSVVGSTLGKDLSVDSNGYIGVTTHGTFAGAGSTVKLSTTLDPVSKTLEIQSTSISGASPKEAAAYLHTLYAGAISVAMATGLQVLTMAAGGSEGAYASAQLGFLPASDGDWYDLKTSIESDLDDGDLAYLKDSLSQSRNLLLTRILSSPDKTALWALSDLPWVVDGTAIGALLLHGRLYKADLDLTDKASLQRYGASQ